MERGILAQLKDGAGFSKGQRRIAAYILENYDKAAFMTASRLGQLAGVSESTVVRFASELGYDGYPGMRKALQDTIRSRLTSVQRIEVARETMDEENVLESVLMADIDKLHITLDECSRESFNQTVEQIASTYGSSAAEIIALNDLETTGLTAGTRILIKGGSLPEKERPEYVPPAPRRTVYTYTTLGNTAARQDIQVLGYFYNLGGPYGRGQCTQWAWYKRQSINPVPANWGNANTWAARAAAQGYTVVRGKPVAGAIFQNSSGWYGHVGFVESVNPDGSFVGSEMNYGYQPYRAIRSTIPAAAAANMNYIYP